MNTTNFLKALGPLSALYQDTTVQEIMVDTPNRVIIEKQGKLMESQVKFQSPEALRALVDAILAAIGVQLSAGQTTVDTRLEEGDRLLIILPPTAIDGPCLVLRKLPAPLLTWEELIKYGSVTQEALDVLKSALHAHRNILIAGNASSGKTTVMNMIAEAIPAEERLVIVQTEFDLRVRHPRAVFLAAGEATGPTVEQLVTTASKMRPDWLVIGELHGPAAMRALEVLNRGHVGLLNIHAESAEDALARLETFCLMANLGLGLSEIRSIIASALHLITFQQRLPGGKRVLTQIVELRGLENGRYLLQPLFRYNPENNILENTGVKPSWD